MSLGLIHVVYTMCCSRGISVQLASACSINCSRFREKLALISLSFYEEPCWGPVAGRNSLEDACYLFYLDVSPPPPPLSRFFLRFAAPPPLPSPFVVTASITLTKRSPGTAAKRSSCICSRNIRPSKPEGASRPGVILLCTKHEAHLLQQNAKGRMKSCRNKSTGKQISETPNQQTTKWPLHTTLWPLVEKHTANQINAVAASIQTCPGVAARDRWMRRTRVIGRPRGQRSSTESKPS